MSSFAKQFISYIQTNNLANGFSLNYDFAPAKKDVLCAYNTGGYDVENVLSADYFDEHPTIQLVCLSTAADTAYTTLATIRDFIQNKTNVVIGSYTYTLFSTMGDVLYLSRDADNRARYALNIRAIRTKF